MPGRSDPPDRDAIRDKIIGLGERSVRKSYYPELVSRLDDLERFRALLDQSRDAILMLELPSYRVVDATASACAQFGASREELLTDALGDLIPPAALDAIRRSLAEPTHAAAGCTIETVAGISAERRPIEISVRPVSFGGRDYAIAVARDIAERTRAEGEILRLAELHRAIVDNAAYMIVTVDANGLITSFNPVAERMTGYTAGEMVGNRTPTAYRDPAELAERALQFSVELGTPIAPGFETLVAMARRNLPNEYEWTYIRKDGSRFIANLSTTALRNPAGDIVGFVSIGSDVTDRKRAEEERERLLAALEQSPDGMLLADVNGNIAYVNQSLEALSGYDRSELVGRPTAMLAGGDGDAPDHPLHVLARGMRWAGEIPARTKDGRPFAAEWIIAPLRDHAGGVVGHVATARDRSAERALEEQLRQAQKMEIVGRLAGGIAHDFNNLLTAILGNAEVAVSDLPADLPGDHPLRSDLEEIAKAGDAAAARTRQLLAFASRQRVEPRRLELGAVVADSLKMLRRILGEDIEIATVIEPGLGAVEADPVQIQQLLVNLAVNARDAMPEGGRLTIEVANAVVDEAGAATGPELGPWRYVRLWVTDTGVGMSDEVLGHLFEPFFTTKERGKGTGLGLAICHGIVKQIGGRISARSEVGRGTTFEIMLPQVGGMSRAPFEETGALPRGTETVMVVEDEPAVRRLAVLALRAQGYTVLEAADGTEAIEMARRTLPPLHALVSDVVMPGLNGSELARRIHEIHPEARLLLMSGHAETSIPAQPAGMARIPFLPKPFTPERLARKVRDVLDAPAPPADPQ